MKVPVSFVTSFDIDDFIEKEAKNLSLSKSDYVEKTLKEYLEKVKTGNARPKKYVFLPRERMFLSIKMHKDLNWEIKHQAILHNITKQDLFNCAFQECMSNNKKTV